MFVERHTSHASRFMDNEEQLYYCVTGTTIRGHLVLPLTQVTVWMRHDVFYTSAQRALT